MPPHPRTKGAQWETLFALPDKPALPLQQRLRLSVVQAILDRRLPAGAPLLVHCESGSRSASAASLLARHGREVVAVEGSFFDWRPAA